MSSVVRIVLILPRALVRMVKRVLRGIWRTLTFPFRTRGIGRERLILGVIALCAFFAACIAYPPLWDKPVSAWDMNLQAAGNAMGQKLGAAAWPGRVARALSPGMFPRTLLGRSLGKYALGLDLVGGAHLEYSADVSGIASPDLNSALSSLRDAIERRVNILGVSEPLVQLAQSGSDHRVIVELAGVTDVNQAIETVGKTAKLEFREESGVGTTTTGPNGEKPLINPTAAFVPTDLTGQYLKHANVTFNATTNAPQVQLEFNAEGAQKFQDITKRNVNKQLAIFLDDQILTAPKVQDEISGGTAVITGQFTLDEARQYANLLNAGALPTPVHLIAQRTVGATLGNESLRAMMRAGIATILLVALFMVVLYRLPGILAFVALLFYVSFLLALFKLFPVTLTLAGIAGLILSIGMAVDANILIFARMREELRAGRTPLAAAQEGFVRAWTAIRDSNISTLLTTVILYEVGTSFVQGFAFALGIGVILSMFTAVFISHYLLREAARHSMFTRSHLFW